MRLWSHWGTVGARSTGGQSTDIACVTCRRRRSGRPTVATLQRIGLFADAQKEGLETLARASTWHTPRRRDIVGEAGECEGYIYLVVAGLVGLGTESPSGQEFIALLLYPGDLFDFTDPFLGLDETSHALALSDAVTVYRLPRRGLERCTAGEMSLKALIQEQSVRSSHDIGELLLDLAFYDAATRLARLLGRLAKRSEDHTVWFTHEELGWMSGLSRAQVTNFLGQLRARHLVSYPSHGHGIHLPDPERMAHLAW